ncbi:DUF883 family protein [Pseudoroseicyclus sp. H15]
MARGTTNGTQANLNEFMKQFESLKADLAELSETAAEIGSAQKEMLKANATGTASAIRARGEATVAELSASARRAASEVATEAEAKVRENPAAAVGIATFIGFLIGLFMTRRR